ncbi:MAG: D-2-hydroxyacid dehydrogenase [Candidatus Thorarchaeota archaeon]|nr:MAG: D-2-hydroxyacid dehydrogenase [Candidatus Thorarchaeota archaeon]
MARVLVADPVEESALQKMQNAGLELVVRDEEKDGPIENQIKGFDCIVVRSATKVTKEVIQAADTLKLVVRAGVGLDNVDIEAAEKAGVKVLNTPEAPTVSVAEMVFSLMFGLARNVAQADSSMKGERWEKKNLTGTELWKKTLGVVGYGRIGQEVGKRAGALDMEVLAYDVIDIEAACRETGAVSVTLDELIERSDFITLHVPLLPQTKNMFGTEQFKRMKNTAFLVNTARGGVVDEAALLDALNEGLIAGAGLDVFESEPPKDWELVRHPKLVATPHLASSTREAQSRVGDLTAEKVIRELA